MYCKALKSNLGSGTKLKLKLVASAAKMHMRKEREALSCHRCGVLIGDRHENNGGPSLAASHALFKRIVECGDVESYSSKWVHRCGDPGDLAWVVHQLQDQLPVASTFHGLHVCRTRMIT